jgi:putative nucleotidyltransferase with HDIG domain
VGRLNFPNQTQAHHVRGVGRIARAMAREMIDLHGDIIKIDPELALAGGLVHDLGKPFLFDSKNIKRWQENVIYTGEPPIRHTTYGAHIALQVGLPEEIVHVIALHETNRDGQYVVHSVYLEIVALADIAYWQIPNQLRLLGNDPVPVSPGAYY